MKPWNGDTIIDNSEKHLTPVSDRNKNKKMGDKTVLAKPEPNTHRYNIVNVIALYNTIEILLGTNFEFVDNFL